MVGLQLSNTYFSFSEEDANLDQLHSKVDLPEPCSFAQVVIELQC